jgi:hypothetical protein
LRLSYAVVAREFGQTERERQEYRFDFSTRRLIVDQTVSRVQEPDRRVEELMESCHGRDPAHLVSD